MEITVRRKIYHGKLQVTYEPICKWAKILAEIAGSKTLSLRMINILKEGGAKITEIGENGKTERILT